MSEAPVKSDRVWLQMKVQKHAAPVFGAIVLIWVAMLGFETTVGNISTDIVQSTCVPWGSYSSQAMMQTISSLVFVVAYLLPLLLMTFFYSRIVYALKHKVAASLIRRDRRVVYRLVQLHGV